MSLGAKLSKVLFRISSNMLWSIHPRLNTAYMTRYLQRHGMIVKGRPNYISAKVWFDGGDYSLIEISEGCTISSNVRILTHDWAVTTVGRAMGLSISDSAPVGIGKPVRLEEYVFVGTGSILLPGSSIGKGSLIGAGTVVRGEIEPFSLVIGNPCVRIGDSREYVRKRFPELAEKADCDVDRPLSH